MSRSIGVPDQHPDDDLLADLAAEVLPADLADRVQHHVIGCARCAALLADAEGIRLLLRQSEPETMPLEVWARLEQAMVSTQRAEQTGAFGTTRSAPTAADATGAIGLTGSTGGSGGQPGGRRAARSGSGPATSSIGLTGPLAGGPPTSKLSRMSRPTQSARRQAIEEQKADRSSSFSLSRFGRRSRLAAAAVVLLGVGTFVLHNALGDGATSSDSTATTSGSAASLLLPPVQSTSTNYSRAQLQSQVNTLLTTSQQLIASGTTGATSGTTGASAGTTGASGAQPASPHAPQRLSPVASGISDAAQAPAVAASAQPGQLLRSPAALQACLNEIGADQQPVAIDLARYAGREAAIIVLPATGGGYQVEVVARDCRPGNDGTIDVVNLKKP